VVRISLSPEEYINPNSCLGFGFFILKNASLLTRHVFEKF